MSQSPIARIIIDVWSDKHVPWWRYKHDRIEAVRRGFVAMLGSLAEKLFARVAPGCEVRSYMELVGHACECDSEPVPGAGWPFNDQAEVERCDMCMRFDDDIGAAIAVVERLNERLPKVERHKRYAVVLCDDVRHDHTGGDHRWVPLVARHKEGGVFEELSANQLNHLRPGAMPLCPDCRKPMRADATEIGCLHCDSCGMLQPPGDPSEYIVAELIHPEEE